MPGRYLDAKFGEVFPHHVRIQVEREVSIGQAHLVQVAQVHRPQQQSVERVGADARDQASRRIPKDSSLEKWIASLQQHAI